ncbi:hypothetical protein H5410_031215 [Solanum commersonii]|uniref:Endonuclease/exonuclease/phosphatase domain-containing protein n=1 Tax=Solanum commersonii TaxID=4109 RepID=A0A9J5YIH7_SOLCO|nr:hypothetical protein H5410_031215 [Solanum commersonii]
MRKTKQIKDIISPEITIQTQITNSPMVNVQATDIEKGFSKRKKFTSTVLIPADVKLGTKEISLEEVGRKAKEKGIQLLRLSNPLRIDETLTIDMTEHEDTAYKDREDIDMFNGWKESTLSISDDELIKRDIPTLTCVKVDNSTQKHHSVTFFNNLSPRVSRINTLSWNIRRIRSQGSLERLKTLKNEHKFPYMFLQEPKIFWSTSYQLDIIEDKEQHVLIHITHLHEPVDFHLSLVYVKCEEAFRIPLWDDLRDISGRITGPWGVVGDFNVITCSDEKIGGNLFRIQESLASPRVWKTVTFKMVAFLGPSLLGVITETL